MGTSGAMNIDVERAGLLGGAQNADKDKDGIKPPRDWKINAAIWGGLGVILVFLIIMASVAPKTPDPDGIVADPVGSVRACPGNDSLCLVVNPVPFAAFDYRNRPRTASSKKGAVAADQSRCSDIGAAILTAGGNAIDAAIATALCQGVVNPFASGVGGGHFMLIRLANGSSEVIDAREPAPGAAFQDLYKGMDADASLLGGLAIAVPLELRGLELAWQRHGSLPWSDLVLPSAAIARSGFAAHPFLVFSLATTSFMMSVLQNSTLMRAAFTVTDVTAPGGWRIPQVGELCCQRPVLADTLEQIAANGVEWLYTDARVAVMAAEIQAAGGIITAADFQNTMPTVDVPLAVTVGDLQLLLPPPPSSAVVIGLALGILAGFPGSLLDSGLLGTYRMVEAMKMAFAVRMSLGDPGTAAMPFVNVTGQLTDAASPAFAAMLRAQISDTSVLDVSAYGGKWNPLLTSSQLADDAGTTHISVVDAQGNAVSMTSSVNAEFGSCVMSASTGILWNNQMDDFSRPDGPNTYGLAPSVANYIFPGKRPLSSMSPSMVLQNGKLRMVVGASGGPRIITATLQSIIRVLLLGQTPLAAVSAARLHNQLLPNVVMEEQYDIFNIPVHVPAATLTYLVQRGDILAPKTAMMGNSQVILVDQSTGLLTAASDPRKDGAPAVVA